MIDDVIQKLEHILESDPRSFSNPVCEYGWIFNEVLKAIQMLRRIEENEKRRSLENNRRSYE